jgi:hypothetical protein
VIPDTLTGPYLIVCEGKGDETFLRHLIEARRLIGFQYAYPEPRKDIDGNRIGGSFGKDGFDDLLGGLTIRDRELLNLRMIVLVTDSNGNPADAFRFAQRKIREAQGYGVPTQLLRPAQVGKTPPILVLTLPWINEVGNLETLVLKAVPDNFPEVWRCLENYYHCTAAPETWDIGKQSKMKMQCVISAVCQDDPTCAMSNLWSKREFLPLLQHECFNQLIEFLETLQNI